MLKHPSVALVVAFGLVALLAAPAAAHHGWGGQAQEETTLTGTLAAPVSLAGPHATMKIKTSDGQVWDITMAPLLSDLDDVLNLFYVPEFGGIDEVYFDLDDIKALQEDVDLIQERERKNFAAGGISFEEFRDAIGRDPGVSVGIFFVPTGMKPTQFEQLGEEPEPAPVPLALPAPEEEETIAARLGEARCVNCGRLLGHDVVAARFDCPRCKSTTIIADGRVLTNGGNPR